MEEFGAFFFWMFFFLVLFALLAWPTWPYTRTRWPYTYGGSYRYAPSGAAAAAALLIILLFWLGILAMTLPWAPTQPVVVQ